MWFWGKTRDNYAVIDVGWGLVIAGIATIFTLMGDGNYLGKLALLVPIWIWAIRLSGFLYFTRIRTNHPEDKRYADFRKDYGDKVHQKFFTNVFLLQGVLALLLSGPSISASSWVLDISAGYEIFAPLLGWVLFCIGLVGETIADRQLHSFVLEPKNKGKVCNIGLWNYTRHPNYFFEWVIWLGIGIIPLRDGSSLISLFSPLFMFVLLRFISGVPFAERYSLKSKGELFVAYQKSTNAFFPWIPKNNR
jgi:steroid 5-alpha reductase family enzyme